MGRQWPSQFLRDMGLNACSLEPLVERRLSEVEFRAMVRRAVQDVASTANEREWG